MSAKRSPNCPAHDLQSSIEMTSQIYANRGRSSFTGEEAVRLLGYNGLNGASRRALGAVRAFGLVVGRGQELKVSDDAIRIIADADAEDQVERQAALFRVLSHNRIFSDLYEMFAFRAAQRELSAYLQTNYHFKPSAADRTANLYRESVGLIGSSSSSNEIRSMPLQSATAATPKRDVSGTGDRHLSDPNPSPSGADISGNPVSPVLHSTPGPGISHTMPTGNIGEEIRLGVSDEPEPQQADLTEQLQDVFNLSCGQVRLSWPEQMTLGQLEDFTHWLIVEHRKIAREVPGGDSIALKFQSRDLSKAD